jgi:mannose-1-phosphate guanylyltransferase
MAGGVGSRFWPISRSAKPKQFLDILGTGKTLLEQTFGRFQKIIPEERILVVTNQEYGALVREQLPELPEENILLEPLRRNTAPCIAYASYKILRKDPDAKLIVAPSDHLIMDEDKFLKIVKQGLEFVSDENALLTLGIPPSRPETGYGYIQVNGIRNGKSKNLRSVKTFTEKPDLKLAQVFLESGEFFWNAGIFFWSIPTIIDSFERYLPEMASIFAEGEDKYYTPGETAFITEAYSDCKNISIDYGIMENADNVHVITSDFGWSDLGTWGSLRDHLEKDDQGNAIVGETAMTYDLDNCLVHVPKDKLVVLQGLQDYVVVESDDVLLVCKMEDEQKIKNIVNDVRVQRGSEFI